MSSNSSRLQEIELVKAVICPHMTEKAYSDSDKLNQYVFKVQKSANKTTIKAAIEKFYNVKVKSVKTLNVLGKTKSFKQKLGKRKDWKKAYVQLLEGSKLDFIGTN